MQAAAQEPSQKLISWIDNAVISADSIDVVTGMIGAIAACSAILNFSFPAGCGGIGGVL
jgi:hypothetical protein